MQVQQLGATHVFDVVQHLGQFHYVMPIYRAKIAYVHAFKDVLLLGSH